MTELNRSHGPQGVLTARTALVEPSHLRVVYNTRCCTGKVRERCTKRCASLKLSKFQLRRVRDWCAIFRALDTLPAAPGGHSSMRHGIQHPTSLIVNCFSLYTRLPHPQRKHEVLFRYTLNRSAERRRGTSPTWRNHHQKDKRSCHPRSWAIVGGSSCRTSTSGKMGPASITIATRGGG